MKRAAVFAGLFAAVFLGSMVTAQAGTHISFGVSIGLGPAVPYGYYGYPAYPYAAYPYPAYAPYYYSGYYVPSRTYIAPGYYGNRVRRYYDSRSYRNNNGNRWIRNEGKSNSRSRSSRWRY